jgi:hypothetical protein
MRQGVQPRVPHVLRFQVLLSYIRIAHTYHPTRIQVEEWLDIVLTTRVKLHLARTVGHGWVVRLVTYLHQEAAIIAIAKQRVRMAFGRLGCTVVAALASLLAVVQLAVRTTVRLTSLRGVQRYTGNPRLYGMKPGIIVSLRFIPPIPRHPSATTLGSKYR